MGLAWDGHSRMARPPWPSWPSWPSWPMTVLLLDHQALHAAGTRSKHSGSAARIPCSRQRVERLEPK